MLPAACDIHQGNLRDKFKEALATGNVTQLKISNIAGFTINKFIVSGFDISSINAVKLLDSFLSQITSLRHLDISNIKITHEHLSYISNSLKNFPHLQYLNVSKNPIGDIGIRTLADCVCKLTALEVLEIEEVQTSNGIDSLVSNVLRYSRGMKKLNISSNNVENEAFEKIYFGHRLISLNLRNCGLHAHAVATFVSNIFKLYSLEFIDISDNPGVNSEEALAALESISLSGKLKSITISLPESTANHLKNILGTVNVVNRQNSSLLTEPNAHEIRPLKRARISPEIIDFSILLNSGISLWEILLQTTEDGSRLLLPLVYFYIKQTRFRDRALALSSVISHLAENTRPFIICGDTKVRFHIVKAICHILFVPRMTFDQIDELAKRLTSRRGRLLYNGKSGGFSSTDFLNIEMYGIKPSDQQAILEMTRVQKAGKSVIASIQTEVPEERASQWLNELRKVVSGGKIVVCTTLERIMQQGALDDLKEWCREFQSVEDNTTDNKTRFVFVVSVEFPMVVETLTINHAYQNQLNNLASLEYVWRVAVISELGQEDDYCGDNLINCALTVLMNSG